jgi:hypothetical protein
MVHPVMERAEEDDFQRFPVMEVMRLGFGVTANDARFTH